MGVHGALDVEDVNTQIVSHNLDGRMRKAHSYSEWQLGWSSPQLLGLYRQTQGMREICSVREIGGGSPASRAVHDTFAMYVVEALKNLTLTEKFTGIPNVGVAKPVRASKLVPSGVMLKLVLVIVSIVAVHPLRNVKS